MLAEPFGGQQPCDLPTDGGAGAVEHVCSACALIVLLVAAFHLKHAQR